MWTEIAELASGMGPVQPSLGDQICPPVQLRLLE